MSENAPDPTSIQYGPVQGQRSQWPVTFGIICLLFGVIGTLLYSWGAISSLFLKDLFMNEEVLSGGGTSSEPEVEAMMKAMTDNMERWSNVMGLLNLLMVLLAILLLVGGIQLLRRKPVAAPLLVSWAYAKIVASIGLTFVNFLVQRGQMEAMSGAFASSGGPSSGEFGTIMSAVAGVTVFISVIWYCALPILLLIWLNRSVIKTDIATWRAPQPAGG